MSRTINAPHLALLESKKIDYKEADISPSLKRMITSWNRGKENLDKLPDGDELITQWTEKLEGDSQKINEELIAAFEKSSDDAAAAKKAEEEAAAKKAEEEAAAKKKADEEAAAAAAAGDKKDEKDEKDDKGSKSKKVDPNNPYGLSDKKLKQKAIIDKLWGETPESGTVKKTEKELNELGFNCSGILGWFSGDFGPYRFKSSPGDETWKITRPKELKVKIEKAA